jgi:hypothetical protein
LVFWGLGFGACPEKNNFRYCLKQKVVFRQQMCSFSSWLLLLSMVGVEAQAQFVVGGGHGDNRP